MAIIASFIVHLHDTGEVTQSGFDAAVQTHQGAAETVRTVMPGSEVISDPWADETPAPVSPPGPAPGAYGGSPGNPATGYAGNAHAGGQTAPQTPYGQSSAPVPQHPSCAHGPLNPRPAGISGPNSRNPGRPYRAFWACNAPMGEPKCRLDQKQLPDVNAFLQSPSPPF